MLTIVAFAAYARAVLNNAHGRHAVARDAVVDPFSGDHPGLGPFLVPELAEAAARTGEMALLESALKWIGQRTSAAPTDWSLGIEARIRAFLSEGSETDAFYRQSIEHLRRTPIRTELGRTHLLYGEWLRREQRRVDTREQLSQAHDMLQDMGLVAFAERARRELAATGASVRRRSAETRDELTPQERQIAELARDGLSNPEIGAKLFLSPPRSSSACARCSQSSASDRVASWSERSPTVPRRHPGKPWRRALATRTRGSDQGTHGRDGSAEARPLQARNRPWRST